MKTKIEAKVVADSTDGRGNRLTSLVVTFPRFILAEVNTHRMLSKNTSSSRAIPFNKMVETVQNDPFIPIAWQKDHKGMQGSEYWGKEDWVVDQPNVSQINIHNCAIGNWLQARDNAVSLAKQLNSKNITKQLCNRLLEPFMWTTMLITGSKEGWDNFFELRCPSYEIELPISEDRAIDWKLFKFKSKKDLKKEVYSDEIDNYTDLEWLEINKGQAEIHMMALAEAIYDAMNESTPKLLQPKEWHIPFGENINNDGGKFVKFMMNYAKNRQLHTYPDGTGEVDMTKVKISTAMAARTSYTVVGDEKEVDYQKMIELHDRLIEMRHDSPLEHCARAMTEEEYETHYKGILSKGLEYYHPQEEDMGWCRNYRGFIQYRHLIEE